MNTDAFVYLLNAMEIAAQKAEPSKHGYAEKRCAVLAHVRSVEKENERLTLDRERFRRMLMAASDILRDQRQASERANAWLDAYLPEQDTWLPTARDVRGILKPSPDQSAPTTGA